MKPVKRKPRATVALGCKYCGRVSFKNEAALAKHQDSGFCAQLKNEEQLRLLNPGLAVVFASTPDKLSDIEEDNATDLPCFHHRHHQENGNQYIFQKQTHMKITM